MYLCAGTGAHRGRSQVTLEPEVEAVVSQGTMLQRLSEWMSWLASRFRMALDFLTLEFLQIILKYVFFYLCHGWVMILKIQML